MGIRVIIPKQKRSHDWDLRLFNVNKEAGIIRVIIPSNKKSY